MRWQIVCPAPLRLLPQQDDVPFFVQFESAVYTGEQLADSDMAAAELAQIINLETGELRLLIVNTVLKSAIERNYPDESYVGKKFAIRRFPKLAGDGKVSKRYKAYDIAEIA